MSDTPPTSPGPITTSPRVRNYRIPLGMLVHGGCVFLACFLVPLVGGSNIWPIAGVFWSVFTVPVAVGTGALTGWMVKNRSPGIALPVLICTGIGIGAVTGFVMASNK